MTLGRAENSAPALDEYPIQANLGSARGSDCGSPVETRLRTFGSPETGFTAGIAGKMSVGPEVNSPFRPPWL